MMGGWWQDIRYGLRMLRKNPSFTIVAVLTLSLGIGANTAIFTLINALLLRSVPGVKDLRQLVLVTDNGQYCVSYALYERLCNYSQSFSGLFLAGWPDPHTMTVAGRGTGESQKVQAQPVSGNFFEVLGVPAVAGRTLIPDDDLPGRARPVVVLSYSLWERRFGLDPTAVGTTITLNGTAFTIVGVAPRRFSGCFVENRPDLWWPVHAIPLVDGEGSAAGFTNPTTQWAVIGGRLKAGAGPAEVRSELDVIFKQMLVEQVDRWAMPGPEGRRRFLERQIELKAGGTGYSDVRREFQGMFLGLIATTSVVLLVACTNLAGLLLARGAARQREISVRVALGAGRLALMRQLLTESLLLAAAGGALSLLLARWGVRLLVCYIPEYGENVFLDLAPDAHILVFTGLVSVGTGLFFGLIPAWINSRQDVLTAIKDQAGAVTGRESAQLWSKALMVGQIALSFCLLIGAALLVRTLQKLQTLHVGFDRENLLVFSLDLGDAYDDTRQTDFHEEVLDRVRNLSGVRSASMSNIQTLGGSEWGYGPFRVARAESDSAPDETMKVRGTCVTRGFFQTMGIPLLVGRDFGPQDEPAAQDSQESPPARPIIIDQTCARKLFGDENPVGKLLRTDGRRPREVIGVVGNVIYKKLRGGPRVSVYSVDTCRERALKFFYVRTYGDPLVVADGIRQVVRRLDPQVEVVKLHTMDEMVGNQLHRERMLAQLASFFSLSALALACLGLYGTLSYNVTRRTREIGIRMALGAQRFRVLFTVIRGGMKLALAGCGLGIILAVALTRVMSSLLYGITPTDPLTFIVTGLLLTAVAFVACWLPARRAVRIDPMVVLRHE